MMLEPDRATIASCPLPMWTMAPDGSVMYVNPAWQRATGADDRVAPAVAWSWAIHPDDAAPLSACLQASPGPIQHDVRFRSPDGVYRWHLLHIAPVGGNVPSAFWIGTAIAIDARRRTEDSLRLDAARCHDIIDSATDIVYSLDLDGRITSVNRAAEHILGYVPADILGHSIEETIIPPDQLERTRAVLRAKLAGEARGAYELDVMAKDGRRVRLEINSRLVLRDGRPVAIHGIARDVTGRAQADAGLARLAAIVADSDDAIVSRALDGTITSWNHGAERLYGFTAAEIVGTNVSRLVPPELADELTGLSDRLARGERISQFETVRLRKGGSRVDVSISLSPFFDADGTVIGISTIGRDITARKQAEARLRVLAEAGRVLASDLDVDAQLRAVAHLAVPTLADWCVVDLLDQGPDLRRVAVTHVDPAKVALAEDLQRRYPPAPDAPGGPLEVMRTGKPQLVPEIPDEVFTAAARDEEHLRIIREVGLRSYVLVPLTAHGRALGTLALVAAESGRTYGSEDLAIAEALAELAALAIANAQLYRDAQEAEVRYRQVFAGVADAILVADADRRYLDANPAAIELLGYSHEELLAMHVEDVVADTSRASVTEYDRFLAERRWQGEIQLRRKDGTTVPVEAIATIVDLPAGPVYLSALRDVSDRHRSARLQRDFLAMVTHDLRTPLSAIKGSAQLLQRRGEYRANQVAAILGATSQMQRLIDDLADVVRHQAGALTLRRAPVDLAALAQTVAGRSPTAYDALHITVTAPRTPVAGVWDAGRIAQILVNLLENCAKYAPAGAGVDITVEDLGATARLSVADQGPGIAPEHLPRLFDRFYRADATGAGGLGLGLHITRMLVEAHGGRIWAESTPGQGSTFTVDLPKQP